MNRFIGGPRPSFQVIDGLIATGARPEKIAFSLVHPSVCINVPISAIHWIEARDCFSFTVNGVLRTFPDARVEVNLRADMAVRIWRLTREIVGQILEITVDGECVSKPRILEPIGRNGRFQIGMGDLDDAQSLAAKMRSRCGLLKPRLIGE
jgi:hypothetical protein